MGGKSEGKATSKERRVILVGAGPGSPDLISVRGARAISEADFVVHDRLVSPELIALARPGAVLINVGKAPTKKRFPQSAINEILVQLATDTHPEHRAPPGCRIVRLKGGDPFIYGLGGDEILALAEVGAKCEVVPGITSSTAVPGCVGIPVTQKGVATCFTVITGHVPPGQPGAADWDHLPRNNATLVVLMGVKNLPLIAEHLERTLGWSAATPAAVIQSGTTHAQRVLRGDLGTIANMSAAAQVASPAIVVFGQVCAELPEDAVVPPEGEEVDGEDGSSTTRKRVWGLAQRLSSSAQQQDT